MTLGKEHGRVCPHIAQWWIHGLLFSTVPTRTAGLPARLLASLCQDEGLLACGKRRDYSTYSKIHPGIWTFPLYQIGSAQRSPTRVPLGLGIGSRLWGQTPATDGMIKSQILIWEWSCVMGYHRHLCLVWFIISANYSNKSVFEWNLLLILNVKDWNYSWGTNRKESSCICSRELIRLSLAKCRQNL